MSVTRWTVEERQAAEAFVSEWTQRLKAERDPRFRWTFIEPGSTSLQQSFANALQQRGAATLAEDFEAVCDALATAYAIGHVADRDFRIIATAAACPKCGRIESCPHQGDPEMGMSAGGLIVNNVPAVLRARLRGAADAARSELAKTRAQRIAEQKAAVLAEIAAATKEAPTHAIS